MNGRCFLLVRVWMPLLAAALCVGGGGAAQAQSLPERVDFNRDIRPIFSDTCFKCHGPDEATREAGLRFDTREGALADLGGYRAIVPGDLEESELYHRITAEDEGDRMPPVDSGRELTDRQIELLKRWIEEGAQWEGHWSLIPPRRPALPEVEQADWPRNPIDRFLLARLEQEGLEPSPEAEKATLIRRVTLDLTGLPPTLQEVDAFVADESPDAYEKVVDRLLDSPRYGERMALQWLDAARYADTNGFHIDNERYMWRWRDWVIRAFNKNKPFDEFTIEQIAGDLLPDPTLEQKIATGFNRNHMINFEGGAIPEEYQTAYVVDRVNTTSTVWLGLTMACAQCHDHKYDPISQEDYFKFYAFFNTVPEQGLDGRDGNATPMIPAPTLEQREAIEEVQRKIAAAEGELDALKAEIAPRQAEWEDGLVERWTKDGADAERITQDLPESLHAGLMAHYPLDLHAANVSGETHVGTQRGGEIRYTGGKAGPAARFDGNAYLDLGDRSPLEWTEPFSYGAWVRPTSETAGTVLARMDDGSANRGYDLYVSGGTVYVHLIHSWPDNAIRVNSRNPIPLHEWSHVLATYDGSGDAAGVDLYIDGQPVELEITHDTLADSIRTPKPLHIGARNPGAKFMGMIDDVRIYDRALPAEEVERLAAESPGRSRSVGARIPWADVLPSEMDGWHSIGPFHAETGEDAYHTAYPPEEGVDLAAELGEGEPKWTPRPTWEDGKVQPLDGVENAATYLHRTLHAPFDREVTLSFGSDDAVKVWLNGEVVLDENVQRGAEPDQNKVAVPLERGENRLLVKVINYAGGSGFYFDRADEDFYGVPLEIAQAIAVAPEMRGDSQKDALLDYYLANHLPRGKRQVAELEALRQEEKDLEEGIPTTMVMQEMEDPRETFILQRGQYDQQGEKVSADTPEVMPDLPEGAENNRLGLAKWIVDEDNPLTARVIVNRYWQMYFGTGLVKTVQDFGAQGEWPSHPRLLDWLATEFIQSGWDVKHMQKLIVTSAAYRQSSVVTPDLLEHDPENRLLARGPRLRLHAEFIRDAALAVSGLLHEEVGGPSVKPYQPPGLWKEMAIDPDGSEFSAQFFEQDHGEDLYRRSMYTFWKRTVPPPSLSTFDAPDRETCTVSRPRTNTPLQALVLMNDPTYVEAARNLAGRMMTEAGSDPADRIAFAFRLVTARRPSEAEVGVLLDMFRQQLKEHRRNPSGATQLLGVGESEPDPALDPVELAAYANVASMILNLDEAITKE